LRVPYQEGFFEDWDSGVTMTMTTLQASHRSDDDLHFGWQMGRVRARRRGGGRVPARDTARAGEQGWST